MTVFLFEKKDARAFGLFGKLTGHAYKLRENGSPCGLSTMETTGGEHCLSTCHTSDMYFYIIDGEADFSVGGELFPVKASDVVWVPKNTEYGYAGKLRYVLFMSPAFSEGCETRTEKSIYVKASDE